MKYEIQMDTYAYNLFMDFYQNFRKVKSSQQPMHLRPKFVELKESRGKERVWNDFLTRHGV